ncbi:hypothetical protein LOK49_LG11G01080 [Camellia lanceoleosa]|uniref:Uncharacterized protein n=2 Tax=Camellia lanceoleosa TaxID=1840588 RepID=A0ACC0G328_9ERIC|nr:hypothetical protein LOK49_LG11G01081 [Camellia lanceoleosa]KAI7995503.1 hypothetical protein LOK49_LG11G01080 [Camellia lanceoleosa]
MLVAFAIAQFIKFSTSWNVNKFLKMAPSLVKVVVRKMTAEEGEGRWRRDSDNSRNDERKEERVSLHL